MRRSPTRGRTSCRALGDREAAPAVDEVAARPLGALRGSGRSEDMSYTSTVLRRRHAARRVPRDEVVPGHATVQARPYHLVPGRHCPAVIGSGGPPRPRSPGSGIGGYHLGHVDVGQPMVSNPSGAPGRRMPPIRPSRRDATPDTPAAATGQLCARPDASRHCATRARRPLRVELRDPLARSARAALTLASTVLAWLRWAGDLTQPRLSMRQVARRAASATARRRPARARSARAGLRLQ